jgi:hypothetical protein
MTSSSVSPYIPRINSLSQLSSNKPNKKKPKLLGDLKQLTEYNYKINIFTNSIKTTDTDNQIPINNKNIPKKEINNIKREILNQDLNYQKINNSTLEEGKIKKKKYKYHIRTNKRSLIKLPEEIYGTDDKELKQIIEVINEEPIEKNGYQKVINDSETKIFKKVIPGYDVILIKTLCQIPFNKDIIYEAIANLEIRKKWDSSFSELKIINEKKDNKNVELLYMIIKSPSLITKDRDNVQQRKIWKNFPNNNSHILHFTSIDSPQFPKSKKYIRANTIISGYYIEDIPGENKSNLIIVSQTDVGGPNWLINKVAPKASKNWVNNLIKGCNMIVQQ